MTTFYFVRHGKTKLNVHSRFQGGDIDSPLLPVGIEQAIQAGKHLSDVRFDFAAISTQKRAMDTANYILTENNHRDGLVLTYSDSLRELGFGEREGEIINLEEEQTINLRNYPHLYDPSPFGGESIDTLIERSTAVIEKIRADYPNGTVLIVAHGVLLITLINFLLGKEKSSWREGGPLENTSISIMNIATAKPKGTLTMFNDITYQKAHKQQDK